MKLKIHLLRLINACFFIMLEGTQYMQVCFWVYEMNEMVVLLWFYPPRLEVNTILLSHYNSTVLQRCTICCR